MDDDKLTLIFYLMIFIPLIIVSLLKLFRII